MKYIFAAFVSAGIVFLALRWNIVQGPLLWWLALALVLGYLWAQMAWDWAVSSRAIVAIGFAGMAATLFWWQAPHLLYLGVALIAIVAIAQMVAKVIVLFLGQMDLAH